MKEVFDTETGMVTISDGQREATVTVAQYQNCYLTLAGDSAYQAAIARTASEHTIRKLLDKHVAQEKTE